MISIDTIAAIASAPGRGAVGIVRLSGPDVPRIAALLLGRIPEGRHACLASFLDARGDAIDQGIALYYPAPASFTGDDVLELFAHGGVLVLDLLMRRVHELGCRAARPGEFSERAFLNGKMDIAQAEAVADLIDAGTAAAARAAVRSMQGAFSARIRELQALLTDLRVHVEAAIDFPDEEIDFLSAPAITGRLARVLESFGDIESAARQGTLLREGLTVVIAGKPNAGKSSLLNRLIGDDVAIVTDAPGTTRDVLRQHLHLDGLPLNLIDTAGLRSALDAAEAEGVRRAQHEMRHADRILYVIDASTVDSATVGAQSPGVPPLFDADSLPENVPVTLVLNKIDLTGFAAGAREGAPAADLPERPHRRRRGVASGASQIERGVPGCGIGGLGRAPAAPRRAGACARPGRGGSAGSGGFAGVRALRRGPQARSARAGGDHRRSDQRGSARRDLWKLLYRKVSGGWRNRPAKLHRTHLAIR